MQQKECLTMSISLLNRCPFINDNKSTLIHGISLITLGVSLGATFYILKGIKTGVTEIAYNQSDRFAETICNYGLRRLLGPLPGEAAPVPIAADGLSVQVIEHTLRNRGHFAALRVLATATYAVDVRLNHREVAGDLATVIQLITRSEGWINAAQFSRSCTLLGTHSINMIELHVMQRIVNLQNPQAAEAAPQPLGQPLAAPAGGVAGPIQQAALQAVQTVGVAAAQAASHQANQQIQQIGRSVRQMVLGVIAVSCLPYLFRALQG